MRKIPTLFRRDPDDMRRVLPEVTPGCEWVLAGEGRSTRKFDGTCVMLDDSGRWWARREVKKGKGEPPNFRLSEFDGSTGKTVGWEPIEQSPFAKFHAEALAARGRWGVGTYELCGPKVNGNPEGFEAHVLVRHDDIALLSSPRDWDRLREMLLDPAFAYEGIVWHHQDGRMAKLKVRDFA